MLRFRCRMAMLATLLILSQPAAFGETAHDQDLTVDVKKNDGMLVVDVDMFVGASPSEVWAVLTDYDHMAQFLPNLRSSKEEGQSNFVNPGILLWNVGVDADLTPKLRAVTNLNLTTISAYPAAFSGAAPGGRTFQVAVGFRF